MADSSLIHILCHFPFPSFPFSPFSSLFLPLTFFMSCPLNTSLLYLFSKHNNNISVQILIWSFLVFLRATFCSIPSDVIKEILRLTSELENLVFLKKLISSKCKSRKEMTTDWAPLMYDALHKVFFPRKMESVLEKDDVVWDTPLAF